MAYNAQNVTNDIQNQGGVENGQPHSYNGAMKMALDQFKKEVGKTLLEIEGRKSTQKIMKDYESDFQRFLDEGWNPKYVARAMVNYLI